MHFYIDRQTSTDLGIFNRYRPDSLFSLFNQVKTDGGGKLLADMFSNPLTDVEEINTRSSTFSYIQRLSLVFPFKGKEVETFESYTNTSGKKKFPEIMWSLYLKKMSGSFLGDKSYAVFINEIHTTVKILGQLRDLLWQMDTDNANIPFQKKLNCIKKILNGERFISVFKEVELNKDSLISLSRCDHLLRCEYESEIKMMMSSIFELDVYIAISNIAKDRGFSYATATDKKENVFQATDLRHPCMRNFVGNHICFTEQKNLIFLTGANMAGKSTIMKSLGLAIYLAHMGFPVPAKNVAFSVKDGLCTSINVPDNLNDGYSHFYTEVLRVKEAAQIVANGKNFVFIFDELFKGTNVKDAYDATLNITEAFSKYTNCFFIVSTHITEAGDVLKERCNNIQFLFMPTVIEGNVPKYTYKIAKGISSDRHGMTIIRNEGILDILSEIP